MIFWRAHDLVSYPLPFRVASSGNRREQMQRSTATHYEEEESIAGLHQFLPSEFRNPEEEETERL